MIRKLAATVACMGIATAAAADGKIVVNAKAWTGNPTQPWAQTIVINDARIVAVGDAKLAGKYPDHTAIDASGALVLPGFIDNHTHFMDGAASLVSIDTIAATSERQFVETIRDFAAKKPAGEWITGGIWDHEAWQGKLPRRDWIDAHSQDNPVFLLRTDGHMAIANSRALALAGVTRDTPDPEGGLIVRDPNGKATGVLKDNAMNLVWNVLPPATPEQNAQMFDVAVAHALKNGVTQIHNMSSWDNIAIFTKAKAEDRLKIRTYYFPHISARHKLAKWIEKHGKGDHWLRFGGVKELVDGSLGSTTAWFYEPYTDQPDTSGFPLMTMAALKTSIEQAHAYGLQLAIHGIGDQAIDNILDIFAQLDVKDARPRIEHAQHLSADAVTRFGKLGVIASMQPYHAIDDGRWAGGRIGAERLKGTYAFASLINVGATVTFGSDWYVAPLSPLSGIYAAVTRRTLDGKNPKGWVPQEKITVEQAVRAYTINNAWAGRQERDLGTIEAGKLADLVILSDNIFEIAPEDIIDTHVTLTMIGGDVLYQAP